MPIHPLAGKPAPAEMLIDVAALERAYYENKPDLDNPAQRVAFGTSGHRGTLVRRQLHRGAHPRHHAGHLRLSPRAAHHRPVVHGQGFARRCPMPAQRTALEVLAANGVETFIQRDNGVTPRRPSSRARFWPTIAVARTAWPTASSSRRRTIRRPMAASNTIRPTAARPIPTSPSGFKIAPTNCCAAATKM